MGFKVVRELNEVASPAGYGVNNLDDTTTASVTYVGMEGTAGEWLVKKIDETSNMEVTYANIVNNPTVTTYADAWSAIVTLTYGSFSEVF